MKRNDKVTRILGYATRDEFDDFLGDAPRGAAAYVVSEDGFAQFFPRVVVSQPPFFVVYEFEY